MPQRAFVILLLLLLRHSSGRGPCTCKNATELEASPLPKTVERVRFDGEPTTCVASHSQYGEEKILTANFGWNETFNGTYLEIGAQDGDGFSNTLALSTCHRWGGVLIEGSRSNFEKLKVFVQRHQRPRVTAFWGAVCAPPKLKVSFSEECGHGMSVGGDVSQMSQSYKRNFGFKHCPPQPVPCKPMSWYLRKALGNTAVAPTVDFMSVDVEGSELLVLETLNFTAVTVNVLMVEMNNHDPAKNWKVVQLLDNSGYRMCTQFRVRGSGVFVRRASALISRC